MKVRATAVIDGQEVGVEAEFNFGTNLGEAVSIFGEKAVWENFLDGATIKVQNLMRRLAKRGMNSDEIQSEVSKYKLMTLRTAPLTKAELLKKFASMTESEQLDFLRELQERRRG